MSSEHDLRPLSLAVTLPVFDLAVVDVYIPLPPPAGPMSTAEPSGERLGSAGGTAGADLSAHSSHPRSRDENNKPLSSARTRGATSVEQSPRVTKSAGGSNMKKDEVGQHSSSSRKTAWTFTPQIHHLVGVYATSNPRAPPNVDFGLFDWNHFSQSSGVPLGVPAPPSYDEKRSGGLGLMTAVDQDLQAFLAFQETLEEENKVEATVASITANRQDAADDVDESEGGEGGRRSRRVSLNARSSEGGGTTEGDQSSSFHNYLARKDQRMSRGITNMGASMRSLVTDDSVSDVSPEDASLSKALSMSFRSKMSSSMGLQGILPTIPVTQKWSPPDKASGPVLHLPGYHNVLYYNRLQGTCVISYDLFYLHVLTFVVFHPSGMSVFKRELPSGKEFEMRLLCALPSRAFLEEKIPVKFKTWLGIP